MTKVYCDTCIYIDALKLKDSNDRFFDFAWSFFQRVRDKEYILVTSDWVFEEFKKVIGSVEPLKELIDSMGDVVHIPLEKDDKDKARKLSKNNYEDALHVILAKKGDAFILTTRNIKHFLEFSDMVEISLPEHL